VSNITIVGTQARTSVGDRWNLVTNALADDAKYAFRASGGLVGDYLVIENFTAGLPQDITINGIAINIKASVDAVGANAHLGVFMSISGKTNNPLYLTATQYASGLTTSELTYTLGGSSYLWGTTWRRPLIHGNPAFSIFVFGAGNLNVGRKVQYIEIVVYYTLNTYLKGERSAFPKDVSLWPYNGPSDSLPRKYNGTGSSNQIKSEDVNWLGDCIYSLEYTALNSQRLIRAEGGEATNLSPQSLLAFTMTLTGSWVGSTDSIYFHNTQRVNGQTHSIISNQTTTNMTNIRWTKPPIIPFNAYTGVFMPMVQGCAWLSASGSIIPLHVTITTFLFRRITEYLPANTDVMSSSIGFRLMLGNATGAIDRLSQDWAGVHYGYDFQQWSDYTSSAQVIVRLTGFGPVGA